MISFDSACIVLWTQQYASTGQSSFSSLHMPPLGFCCLVQGIIPVCSSKVQGKKNVHLKNFIRISMHYVALLITIVKKKEKNWSYSSEY